MPDITKRMFHPTVDTCPYRRRVVLKEGESLTRCDLVDACWGADQDGLACVDDDICRACCESFPPTPERWNPVIASLVFRGATQLLTGSNPVGADTNHIRNLRNRATKALDLVVNEDARLTPAHSMETCCYFMPSDNSSSIGKSADFNRQNSFPCRHPNHPLASEDICRRCRDWIRSEPISQLLPLDRLVPAGHMRDGRPVRRWAVGITTAPRRQATLSHCLDSLIRAGWESAHLFLDGTVRVPQRYEHLPVTWRERNVGPWPAYYLALTELLLQTPDADAYLLLQDDAFMHDRHDLKQYLERVLWPGDREGIVSLYFSGVAAECGWHYPSEDWVWGAVALVFPRSIARTMVSDPMICQSRWTGGEHQTPIDGIVNQWARQNDVTIWFPYPSLVQHIGNTSTIWDDSPNQGARRAKWFSASLETPFANEESLVAFPEDRFPCPEEHGDAYRRTIVAGKERMRRNSVVIGGLCRDVRHFLPRTIARIEHLGEMFDRYQVVLFENDSEDGTDVFLADWQARNERVHVISQRLGTPRFPSVRSGPRATQLAWCREQYRQYIDRHCSDEDFVIVVDTDIAGGWSYDGIAHSFGEDGWDFVGSYGLLQRNDARRGEFPFVHYDTWALRPSAQSPRGMHQDSSLALFQRGMPMVPVDSCFGGLGLYRMACMQLGRYAGEDCEHVTFHESLRRSGMNQMYLNPNQLLLYSPL